MIYLQPIIYRFFDCISFHQRISKKPGEARPHQQFLDNTRLMSIAKRKQSWLTGSSLFLSLLLSLFYFAATAQNVRLVSLAPPISFNQRGNDDRVTKQLTLTFQFVDKTPKTDIVKTIYIEDFAPDFEPLFYNNLTNTTDKAIKLTFKKSDFKKLNQSFTRTVDISVIHPKVLPAKAQTAYLKVTGQIEFAELLFEGNYPGQSLEIVSKASIIPPLLSDTTQKTIEVPVIIQIRKASTSVNPIVSKNDTLVKLTVTKPGGNQANVSVFPQPEVLLSAGEIKLLNQNETVTKTIYLQISAIPEKDFEEESVEITIPGATGSHRVTLSQRGRYNPNQPFWVEVGSNFDLVDGLKPNNFFSGVFFFKRDIRPLFKSKGRKEDNLGIFAGVFESKATADISEEKTVGRSYYTDQSVALKQGNNVGVFVDSGTVKTVQVSRNLGLFFSPQIRISRGGANYEGLHFFTSLWLEIQWQRISQEQDFSSLKRKDTLFVVASEINKYADKATKIESNLLSHYIGMGLPVYFKEGKTNVFFNPVIGVSNQPSANKFNEILAASGNPVSRNWKMFYVFQFRLSEEHFGISFTGEVRGLLSKGSPPFVTLALSKKFDLGKFVEFTK